MGKVDPHAVAVVGTGGTITGVLLKLKQKKPGSKPSLLTAGVAGLSGGNPDRTKSQGIGAVLCLNSSSKGSTYTKIIQMTNENAGATARRLAKREGIFSRDIFRRARPGGSHRSGKKTGKQRQLNRCHHPDTGETLFEHLVIQEPQYNRRRPYIIKSL